MAMEDHNNKDNVQNPHAILFPLPFQGHVTPMVNLAVKLAMYGFKITFVNTHKSHQQMAQSQPGGISSGHGEDIFAGARESGLDIRYATMSDGFPLTFDRMVNHEQFLEGLFHVFPAHVDELVGTLVKEDPSLSCVITDSFHTWTTEIAKKYDLVSVSLWTQPALVFTLDYHMDLLKMNGHFASQNGNREDTIDYIPGVKSIEPKDLMPYLRQTDVVSTTSLVNRHVNMTFDDLKKVDFILCNTVEDLELETLCALQKKQPIYAIGPLILPPRGPIASPVVVPTSLRSEVECSQWLNTKPKGSVLYVSLGSSIPANKADIEELAYGLVLSKASFIWVLRPDAASYKESHNNNLPIEFDRDRIKDKGLIVPWCNQMGVISHPAIGGFLTHCGWNSTLDGMWSGVPMLCFPMAFDQITNRKLVVDDWRIGLNLCDGDALTRAEVAEKIDRLMNGKSAEKLRAEAIKVSQTMKNALDINGGSSDKNLCQFVSDVKAKVRDQNIDTIEES